MEKKDTFSIRLSAEAKKLLASLATSLGITQAAVIELAIREKAKREALSSARTTLHQK